MTTSHLRLLGLATLALLAPACKGDRPHAGAGANAGANPGIVFTNLPLPPEGKLVSRSGGSDAVQLTFSSTSPPPVVADYYRTMLTKGDWRLISDTRDSTGAISLYAEQNGPPMWVRVSWEGKTGLTMISVTGALVPADTTKRAGTPIAPSPRSRS